MGHREVETGGAPKLALVAAVLDERTSKAIEALGASLSNIRAGRAEPGLLGGIRVDVHGSMTPLSQAASLSVIDARTIGVSPWDKSLAGKIEKAIRDGGLGFNPVSMGAVIRVPLPIMSQERRREFSARAREIGESANVSLRSLRKAALDEVKLLIKEKSVSEDEAMRAEVAIQKLTDRRVGEAAGLISKKEMEIMAV